MNKCKECGSTNLCDLDDCGFCNDCHHDNGQPFGEYAWEDKK